MSEVKQIGNMWYREEEMDAFRKWEKNRNSRIWHVLFNPNPEPMEKMKKRQALKQDNRKYAQIVVGKTPMLAFVDQFTHKAYRHDQNMAATWMEIPKYTFVRWATTFDL